MKRSEAQIRASRSNGTLSEGPKSNAGKRRSSENSLKHGLSSKRALIPGEDEREFHEFRDGLWASLSPQNPVEEVLVERIIGCYWKLRRAGRIGNELLERVADKRSHESWIKTRGMRLPLDYECGWAFEAMNSKAFNQLERHEVRLERSAQRALHELERLRAGVVPLAIDVDIVVEPVVEKSEEEFESSGSPVKDFLDLCSRRKV